MNSNPSTYLWIMNKYFGAVSLTDLTRTLGQSVAPAIQTNDKHETFNSMGTAYCFVAMENYPSKLSNNYRFNG